MFDSLTIADLQLLLKKKKLPVSGSKPELVKRLKDANLTHADLNLTQLKNILRDKGLPVGGNKNELIDRIKGTVKKVVAKSAVKKGSKSGAVKKGSKSGVKKGSKSGVKSAVKKGSVKSVVKKGSKSGVKKVVAKSAVKKGSKSGVNKVVVKSTPTKVNSENVYDDTYDMFEVFMLNYNRENPTMREIMQTVWSKLPKPKQEEYNKLISNIITKESQELISNIKSKFKLDDVQNNIIVDYISKMHIESRLPFIKKLLNNSVEYLQEFLDTTIDELANQIYESPDRTSSESTPEDISNTELYGLLLKKLRKLDKESIRRYYTNVLNVNVPPDAPIREKRKMVYLGFLKYIEGLTAYERDQFVKLCTDDSKKLSLDA
jgi:hypothetical protein